MKKILSVVLSLFLVLSLSVCAFANFSSDDVVFDAAQTLDTSQYGKIVGLYEDTREKYNIDIVYAAYSDGVGSAAESADIVYNSMNCGYGATKDGIMLYYNTTSNMYIVRLYGRAADLVELDDVYAGIDPYLTSNQYTFTDAALAFGYSCDMLLDEAINGVALDDDDSNTVGTPSTSTELDFENYPLYDEAGLLSEEAQDELNDYLDTKRTAHNTEIAFVTSTELYSSTAQASADDIFDYSGYGYGADKEGIILYICKNTREYAFSTHGDKTISAFTDDALIYLEEKVLPYLQSDDYEGAVKVYADTCDELLTMAENGTPYKVEHKKSVGQIILTYVIAIAIAGVVAFILTKNKLSQMKTAVAKKEANDYVKPGSMNVTYANDIFLYSNVTREEKPKDNNSGSSTHTSSSGRTHGGRSGSF